MISKLAAVVLAGAAPAPSRPATFSASVPVAELQGLTVGQVQAALGGAGPWQALIRALTPTGEVSIYSARTIGASDEDRFCAGLIPESGFGPHAAVRYGPLTFSFENGLFTHAFAEVWTPPPRPRSFWSMSDGEQPTPSRLVPGPGALPLEDEPAGWLARLPELPATERVVVECSPRAKAPQKHSFDSAGFFQGIGAVPFALLTLPKTNAERARARRSGAEIIAELPLGATLGGGPDAFARAHSGIRMFRGRDPNFALLSVDVGAPPSNNVTSMHEAAFLGVRDSRVVWVAYGGGVADALCRDANGKRGAVRPGCSSTGWDSPDLP